MTVLEPAKNPRGATAFYSSHQTLRSRSVSPRVLWGTVEIPTPPPRLVADWRREISENLALEPGDVEVLRLARARMRWPDYGRCEEAAAVWTHALGLRGQLATSEGALMACRGARYHHDGAQYGGAAFCNLFLSEDRGLDLLFPFSGHRIPLRRGTVVLFDTGQAHGVVIRNQTHFAEADFAPSLDRSQVFLTWELPIEAPALADALDITFDTAAATALLLREPQVWHQGGPGDICPHSGRWRPNANTNSPAAAAALSGTTRPAPP
jgi:hypothetical protein